MGDWRKLEQQLVDYFRYYGYRPTKPTEERNTGEWIVKHGNKPINLSALARELTANNP